ncbi:MAG TPA: DMT family transporter [Anaerolineae bacterium]|nr:DMT family transporter [Anaerolineae bacterium]
MQKTAQIRLFLILACGIFAVSTASILIRFALDEDVPPLIIAAYRLTLAALILTPIVLRTRRPELRALTRRDWQWALLSGFFLALHFATWISSLDYTTVTSSVVLVTTGPIWVALLSWLIWRERLTRPIVLGLIIAVLGGMLVGFSDSRGLGLGGTQLWGDFLALAGAWFVAGYLLIGRQLRHRMSLLTYIYIVYGSAALWLIALAVLSGASFTRQANGQPYPASAYVWMLLLAILPQLVGHSSYNYALRFLPPTYVAIVSLAEPIGSSILAFVLLQEVPLPLTIVGAIVILIGIGLASWPARSRTSSSDA